ncbi:class-II fumarase/aspartase family protein [Actinophytocola oryzae]|uniref:3-carboxy-cis,cis-muconate cycloisomerase n=1 Tax=Actinophytocola oryzae TaxID=502181 RepID=A0A4R7W516_9PSEU|nr:adenylosuccinate lyase family protein [Actinophytocola oryzae]TDV57178.1 3-carboxy-cis,cis-muconate cycloisomerase [Actinophytocola oryzae]
MNADTGLLSLVWPGTGMDTLLADEAWVEAMLSVEVALARTQARLGVVPASAVGPIAAAAEAVRVDVADLAVRARGSGNPVVELVRELTAAVAERDEQAAEYVHRGGTSQDILDSATMLLATRALARTDADLARVADALARLADEHRHTPMAARTLTQHAVPTTFGLKAAGWLALVLDAVERVRDTRLPVQLGGAGGTLAAYLEYARTAGVAPEGHAAALTEGVAAELGLHVPAAPWHTRRTPVTDLGWVAVTVTGALGKLAVDVLGATRTEVGEVAEPSGAGSGVSSAMPQKRNPVLAALLVSAARQAPAYAAMLAQSMLAEDERSAGGWQSEWQPLRETLRLAGGAAHTAAELVEGLRVFPGRLRENLAAGGGTIVSERLNVVLAPVLGKAAAKKLLGEVAARAASGEGGFADLLRRELRDVDDLDALLDPAGYLGAADELVDRVLARRTAVLG